MKYWLTLLILLTPGLALAQINANAVNANPVYPPACGTNATRNSAGCSSFGTGLFPSLTGEKAAEDTERALPNFVFVGYNANACLGSTGVGLTMTPISCVGYNAGVRGTETGSITFANGTTTWVAMDACAQTPTGCNQNNPNLPNFTRVAGTHYLTDAIDVSQPSVSTDSQLLMEVVTSGGSITGVTDLRNSFAAISNFPNLTATRLTATNGTVTNLTANQISNATIDQVFNVKTYGAVSGTSCPVATDSTAAFNAATAAMRAFNGGRGSNGIPQIGSLVVPPGSYEIKNATLNWTNLVGAVQAEGVTLCGDNGGVVIDETGGNNLDVYGELWIQTSAGAVAPSTIGILQAPSTTDASAGTHFMNLRNVHVRLNSIPSVNKLTAVSTLTAASESLTTATFTTSAPHNLSIGEQVVVSGVVPSGYNSSNSASGTWTVASIPANNQFTATLVAFSLGNGSAFGTVVGTAGTIGLYNYGAEQEDYHNCEFNADTGAVITANNIYGITSSFQTIASGSLSMTEDTFGGGANTLTSTSGDGPAILLENTGQIRLRDTFLNTIASPNYPEAIKLLGSNTHFHMENTRTESYPSVIEVAANTGGSTLTYSSIEHMWIRPNPSSPGSSPAILASNNSGADAGSVDFVNPMFFDDIQASGSGAPIMTIANSNGDWVQGNWVQLAQHGAWTEPPTNSFATNNLPDLIFKTPTAALTLPETGFNTGVANGAGFNHTNTASCTTGAAQFDTCSTTVTWPVSFADTNYTATCTMALPTNSPIVQYIGSQSAGTIAVTVMAMTAAAASGTIECTAVHN